MNDISSETDLRETLNAETAKINWLELQSFFARGQVVQVFAGLDLIEVAYQLAQDNTAQFEQWVASGDVASVSDVQASTWYEKQADLWVVVVKPWVLVQDK